MALAGAPGQIGETLVGEGRGVGQAVEGERTVVEIARLVGLLGKIGVADFGPVLGVDEFAQFAGHVVDALLQALGLRVEDMDEAVEELVAVRGQRRAVGREPGRDDLHDVIDGSVGVFRVVDRAGVRFAACRFEAEEAAPSRPVAGLGGECAVGGVDCVGVIAVMGRVECRDDAKGPLGGIVRVLLVVIVEFIDAGISSFRPELPEFFIFVCSEGIVINVLIIHNLISPLWFRAIKGIE